MWETASEQIQEAGGEVLLGMNVQGLARDPDTGIWTVTAIDGDGNSHQYSADHVISSAAIADLAQYLQPAPPEAVLTAAKALRYRDFLTVALIVRDVDCFDDNWIYIHDSSVKVGRMVLVAARFVRDDEIRQRAANRRLHLVDEAVHHRCDHDQYRHADGESQYR